MRYLSLLIVLIAALLVAAPADAAVQVIEAQGVHVMGDNDSPKTAKAEARKEAMRVAVEKAGVYVESRSKVENLKLTEDEVRTISGAVLKVTAERDVPTLAPDGVLTYTVYITAQVDTDGINLKEMMQRKNEIERLQKERDALKKQNEELLEKYGEAKANERARLGSAYNASTVLERGAALLQRGDNTRVINEMNTLIGDKKIQGTQLAYAYYLRGCAYYGDKNFTKALQDLTDSLRITPEKGSEKLELWRAYYYRGLIYYDWRRWDDAVIDLQTAYDASGRKDAEIGAALERAKKELHPDPPAQTGGTTTGKVDWGQVITGVIIGAINQGK